MAIAPVKQKAPLIWGLVMQVPPANADRHVLCLDEKLVQASASLIKLPVNLHFLAKFVTEAAVYKVLCDYVNDFSKAATPLKASLTKTAAHGLRYGLFESAISGTPKRTLELAKVAMLEDFKWKTSSQRAEAMAALTEIMVSDVRRFGELDKALFDAVAPPLMALRAQLPRIEVEKERPSLVGRLLGRQAEPEAPPPPEPFVAFKRQFWGGVLQVLNMRQTTGAYQSGVVRIDVGFREYEAIREPLLAGLREFAGEAALALP